MLQFRNRTRFIFPPANSCTDTPKSLARSFPKIMVHLEKNRRRSFIIIIRDWVQYLWIVIIFLSFLFSLSFFIGWTNLWNTKLVVCLVDTLGERNALSFRRGPETATLSSPFFPWTREFIGEPFLIFSQRRLLLIFSQLFNEKKSPEGPITKREKTKMRIWPISWTRIGTEGESHVMVRPPTHIVRTNKFKADYFPVRLFPFFWSLLVDDIVLFSLSLYYSFWIRMACFRPECACVVVFLSLDWAAFGPPTLSPLLFLLLTGGPSIIGRDGLSLITVSTITVLYFV